MGPDERTISMGYTVIFPYLCSNFFLVILVEGGHIVVGGELEVGIISPVR